MMNTNTGELVRLQADQEAPEGFYELLKSEGKQADVILGDKNSVMLPEDHPLRAQVAQRVGRPATERQLKAILRYRAKMGTDFWNWVKEHCPDVLKDMEAGVAMNCGQAQKLLTLLQKNG